MNRYIHVLYNKNNHEIKKIKSLYKKYLYEFHKRFVKLRIYIDINNKKLEIKLIGFDKKVKHKYKKFKPKKIFQHIDAMPMGKTVNKKSLSLYADYNPKTTIKGLGFKNKEKALHTIKVIKNLDYKYQINVINTMINRAKYHPHLNKDMKIAIKIFEKYKKKIKLTRKS